MYSLITDSDDWSIGTHIFTWAIDFIILLVKNVVCSCNDCVLFQFILKCYNYNIFLDSMLKLRFYNFPKK